MSDTWLTVLTRIDTKESKAATMALRQFRPLMAIAGFLSLASVVSAVDMTYCSSLLTSSDNASTFRDSEAPAINRGYDTDPD